MRAAPNASARRGNDLGSAIGHIVPQRMRLTLRVLRSWLVQNNATVVAVLQLVLGAALVGKGIGSF